MLTKKLVTVSGRKERSGTAVPDSIVSVRCEHSLSTVHIGGYEAPNRSLGEASGALATRMLLSGNLTAIGVNLRERHGQVEVSCAVGQRDGVEYQQRQIRKGMYIWH